MAIKRTSRIRGFTLAEILAALALMAVVVPVAIQGMSIANRAGQLGVRKAAAARVAARILNEMMLTGQLEESSSQGSVTHGEMTYEWTLESQPWTEDTLSLVTVRVNYTVQDQPYEVSVCTLYDPNASALQTAGSADATVRF